MNRCTTTTSLLALRPGLRPRSVAWLTSMACCATLLMALPATAQVEPGLGLSRPFPDQALRGTLTIAAGSQAVLNGTPIRMAPGMRLFSPQNNLVMLHNVTGQSFKVNYLIENSTGMLLSAWILTQGEAAQPRKGSDATPSNITTGSGAVVN